MKKYYIKIRIEYGDYERVSRSLYYYCRGFDEPQPNLAEALKICVVEFYENHPGCDIFSLGVIENNLFEK